MLNRINLTRLADYLDSLPDNYEAFEMAVFFTDPDQEDHPNVVEYALKNGGVDNCGAVACAVGHGPSAGILVPEELVNRDLDTVYWSSYIDRFFIEGYRGAPVCSPQSTAFNWMFSDDWSDIDNTPKGAAKRIRWLLAGNEIPTYYDVYWEGDRYSPRTDHVALYA